MLLSAATNQTVAEHGKTGANGLGTVCAHVLTAVTGRGAPVVLGVDVGEYIDAIAAVGLLILVCATRRARRLRAADLAVPLPWLVGFLAPTLMVRNHQIYYAYEPLIGLVLLVGVWLADVGPRARRAWTVAVVLLVIGGIASNRAALYDWQFTARYAEKIRGPVVEAYRDAAPESIVVVTRERPFWRWVLTADDLGPMLPALLHRPEMRVRVTTRDDPSAGAAAIVFDADADFRRLTPGE
jgi:hypothetical protein